MCPLFLIVNLKEHNVGFVPWSSAVVYNQVSERTIEFGGEGD